MNVPEYRQSAKAQKEQENLSVFLKSFDARKIYEFPDMKYEEKEGKQWEDLCSSYKEIESEIVKLEMKKEMVKGELVKLSDNQDSRGAGISVTFIERKGNIDYARIPVLFSMDLEQYRKPSLKYPKVTIEKG